MNAIRLHDYRCFNLFSYGIFYSGIFWVVFLFLGAGCSALEINRAFEGDFNSQKNNKVIGEYCTSCHIHKELDSEHHLDKVRLDYKRRLFRITTECRACHYLEKKWVHNRVLRKTRRPQEVNRGDFKEFEKKDLKIPEKAEGARQQEKTQNREKEARQQEKASKSEQKLREKENEYRTKYGLGKS